MEGDEQRRRQYEQQNYSRAYVPDYGGHGVNMPNVQSLRGAPARDGSDRFRQAQPLMTRPSTTASLSASAGNPHQLGSYDYGPGQHFPTPPIHGPQFHYQSEYMQDPQRQRQMPQYTSQFMYNVPQQTQSASPYDTVNQFQSRQSAAPVLGSQFGAPQYYSPGHSTNVSGPAAMPQQYPTTAYPSSMPYTSAASLGRPTLASTYSAMEADFNPDIETAAPEQPVEEPDMFAAAYNRCRRVIESVNELTFRGRLIKAGELLLEISQWLLENADDPGLTQDDEEKQAERISFWDSFNLCWLALLQRQEDDTRQMLSSGRPPVQPQNLLPEEFLDKIADVITSLSDGLYKHGLVDYQMGVSEQEIVEILDRCMSLLESNEANNEEAEIDPMLGQSHPSTGKQ